jgi:hypothetical protein
VALKFGPAGLEQGARDHQALPMPANFRVFRREPSKQEASWNRALWKFNVGHALDLVLESGDNSEIVGMTNVAGAARAIGTTGARSDSRTGVRRSRPLVEDSGE